MSVVHPAPTGAGEPYGPADFWWMAVELANHHGGAFRAGKVPVQFIPPADGIGQGQQDRPTVIGGAGDVGQVAIAFNEVQRPNGDRGCGLLLTAGHEGDEHKDTSHA